MSWYDNIRVFLTVVFLVSGIAKYFNLAGFRHSLEALAGRIRVPSAFALAFPGLEILVTCGLWVPHEMINSAWMMIILLGILGVINLVAWSLHLAVHCNCLGGLTDERFGPWSLGKTLVLMTLAIILATHQPSESASMSVESLVYTTFASLGLLGLYIGRVAWHDEEARTEVAKPG